MKRVLSILEGSDQGRSTPLTASLIIVGRSKDADVQVDDPQVSRCHLEIRLEREQAFVQNRSSYGSLLNGKPLAGAVSLTAGDVLTIGHTKLRYDETDDVVSAVSSEAGGIHAAGKDSQSGTALFDGQLDEESEEKPDATRAVVADGTRMLDPSELPGWKAPVKDNAPSTKAFWMAGAAVLVFLATLSAYWILQRKSSSAAGEMEVYRDSEFVFNLQYPGNWSKTTDRNDVLRSWGIGSEGSSDWTRVDVYADKHPQHALTGLTDGFRSYREILKSRHKGFELTSSNPLVINGVTLVFYRFKGDGIQGKGIYVLNSEARVVVECFSSRLCYDERADMFSSILQSFGLRPEVIQEFIDFPLPDMKMQQFALSNPSGLAQQLQEHKERGDALVANKDVKPDNLYQAIQEYRQACQLALAAPKRLSGYQAAAQGLRNATLLFNQALERQRFEINRALRDGDKRAAYWEANKTLQMVPDKTDPAYQEAYKIMKNLYIH